MGRMKPDPVRRYDAVLFDLLSALLDSGTLWNAVAGTAEDGRRWRTAYLAITYETGAYRPYTDLVAEAAVAAGLDRALAQRLDERYGELMPWPEAQATLGRLAAGGLRLGIVPNCSKRLGRVAADRVGVAFDALVTAEEAGFYKPDPRPYRSALDQLGVAAERCLFVAGSPYDLFGTASVGLPTLWHDRIGLALPAKAPAPLAREPTLAGLPGFCGLG